MAFKGESASFHQLRQKLLERSFQGLPADDIIMSDVKQWVTNTINRLSNRVEFIGQEIEKAVFRQTVLDHDQLLSNEVGSGNLQPSDLLRESPPYSVLCASPKGYEAREYERTLWALTFGNPGESFLAAKLRCESKMKKYVLGYNERGVKIKVTSPWLSRVSSNNEEGADRQYSFLFYLPTTMQDDPPPPEDRSIFFEYMSPKVFAFSYVNEASEDADRTLMQDVTSQLVQSQERFHTIQYYLADYEAPFYKKSTNKEILIPMDDNYVPHCGEVQPEEVAAFLTIPPSTGKNELSEDVDVPCIDCSKGQTTTEFTQTSTDSPLEPIHLQLMRSAKYLCTTTNICSAEVLDIAIMDLFLNYQSALPAMSVLSTTPQNVLLWIKRTAVHGAETCNQVSVDVLLEIPRQANDLELPENLKGNISIKTLPSALIYTKPFGTSSRSPSLLDTAFPEYYNLQRRLLEDSLCFAEREFFINANLESESLSSSQVWIPYSNGCWNNGAFMYDTNQDNTEDTQRNTEESESSGSNALVIDDLW